MAFNGLKMCLRFKSIRLDGLSVTMDGYVSTHYRDCWASLTYIHVKWWNTITNAVAIQAWMSNDIPYEIWMSLIIDVLILTNLY